MVKTVFKTPVSRYSFVVFLITFLCGLTFYLSLKYNRAQKLRRDVQQLVNIRENASQIDRCILTLYSADNDSRLFAATSNPVYLKRFLRQVGEVDSVIEKLAAAEDHPVRSSSEKISSLIDRKSVKTRDYVRLKKFSDSLFALSVANSTFPKKDNGQDIAGSSVRSAQRTDTIVKARPKKFLNRIFGIFSKKKAQTDTTVIAANAEIVAPPTPKIQRPSNYVHKLYQANTGLRATEREILLINSGIIHELITVLKVYKDEEQRYTASRNQELRGNLNAIFAGISQLSVSIGIVVGLLILTLLYNLWKIFRHNQYVVAYSEKATQIADDKSAFLANMSHEIRTPLNSIAGFAEQLEKSSLDEEQGRQISAVRSSTGMLLNIVNQVLDFSKYETGKMKFEHAPFPVHKVMTDVTTSMRILAEQKGIGLRSQLDYNDELYLCGDAFRLRQVIMNLVGNAIKFTKVGEVVLRMWITPAGDDMSNLHVSVRDTGIGMDQEDLPNIFKEFSQAGDSHKLHRAGTGLGLAISKSIVELQGGTISVESERGRGSEFSFHIPFQAGEKVAEEKDMMFIEEDARAFLKNKRILLAEDNIMNVMLAKTILNKWKMSCDVAYNGKEALQLFEKNDYDLVLTDIHMPEMGGVELASSIRRSHDEEKAHMPILALTASVLKEEHEHYLACGINAIASKPFFEKELIRKIESVIKSCVIEVV